MDEYIKRGAVLAKAYWHGDSCTQSNPYPDGVEAVDVSAIEQIPAADVRPVVHGEWRGEYDECSICGGSMSELTDAWIYFGVRFCPWCGADMRGENDDD